MFDLYVSDGHPTNGLRMLEYNMDRKRRAYWRRSLVADGLTEGRTFEFRPSSAWSDK